MAEEPLSRLREIFEAAFDLPAAERMAYLDQRCAGEPELRQRVETLLATAEGGDAFLSEPTAMKDQQGESSAVAPAAAEAPGTRIGPYKLLEQIGEGGFGTVFMAEQEHPVRRRVALKIIKLGMDTRQVIARFEAERQALAMMDHPGIARVLDAGATESGRPYFVMELVRGEPITAYCDRENLTIPQRLDLFCQVCTAVQHAHQKGVIHRDLKPSNILVTEIDGRPTPKIIDFGIAKAISGRLTDKTLFTEFRQLIGTPEYMSPEQAGLDSADIDTRSDIYSLGVLLYHLLTGAPPFDPQRLRSAAWEEMRRIIREDAPARPSTRLHAGASDDVREISEIAARRGAEPARLAGIIRGDLDWIAMKCLDKDRSRRYEAANGLAEDIARHLRSEPVLAGPPGRLYRARKFVRRNRGTVVAAALITVAMLTGMAGTTFGFVRAEERRLEAVEAQQLAERREQQMRQVANFHVSMLDGIDAGDMGRGIKAGFRAQVEAALARQYVDDPSGHRKRTPEEIEAGLATFDEITSAVQGVDLARRVMDDFVLARAGDALKTRFAEQPLVRARLHEAIGRVYLNLDLHDAAEPHLREALATREAEFGADAVNAELTESMCQVAALAYAQGDAAEAERLYRIVLDKSRQLGDDEHVEKTLSNLGSMLMPQRRYEEAEGLFEEALRMEKGESGGDDLETVGSTLNQLAVLRIKQGQFEEAEELNQRVLEMRRSQLGEGHRSVAVSLHNLGHSLYEQGRHRYDEAEELFRQALAINRAEHGEDSQEVGISLYTLGSQLVRMGRRPEGEALYREALACQRRVLGVHPDVRATLRDLAESRQQDGDYEEAVELLRQAVAITEQLYPDGHPEAWRRYSTIGKLGGALAWQAKALLKTDRARAIAVFEEAAPLINEGYDGMEGSPERDGGENKRLAVETTIVVFNYWHRVDPDRGWDKVAAEWQAKLEKLSDQ